ncbi:MAG TPA: alkaline phosphatase, partial [Firmicutes bacterium]|nr:alkaline phosphatase [Bacillota bacterium]
MVLSQGRKPRLLVLAFVLVLLWSIPGFAETPPVRNVILLIGDGMGVGQITAAR